MGKSSAPPAPDYKGAAEATAQGNLDASRYATVANRPNQITPYGSLTWTQGAPTKTFNQQRYDDAVAQAQKAANSGDGSGHYEFPNGVATWVSNSSPSGSMPDRNDAQFYDETPSDQWTQTVNLNDTGQQLLDQYNKTSLGLAGLQDQAMQRVSDAQSQPFDYGSVKDVEDAAYKAYADRLDPQWAQREDALRTRLANQGITDPGSEAYQNEMRNFNQGRNDAYQQATLGAISTMPQTFQLAQALRSLPLNELNALRTGSQVTNPTFNGFSQQATTAGPNYTQAADATGQWNLANYNAQQAQDAGLMKGLFSIGSAALGAPSGSLGSGLFSLFG